jgi:hypothetical protein
VFVAVNAGPPTPAEDEGGGAVVAGGRLVGVSLASTSGRLPAAGVACVGFAEAWPLRRHGTKSVFATAASTCAKVCGFLSWAVWYIPFHVSCSELRVLLEAYVLLNILCSL